MSWKKLPCLLLDSKKTVYLQMRLEKISKIRKPNFQIITWASIRIFLFLLCAYQDNLEEKMASEVLGGSGVNVTGRCAPLQQGFCMTQEQ